MSIYKIILKSLFSKPATAMYPARKRECYANTRGSIDNRIESCIFCGICVKKCPTKALEVVKGEKQWSIDRFRCISCGACVDVCPKKCLDMNGAYTQPATKKSIDRFTQPASELKETLHA